MSTTFASPEIRQVFRVRIGQLGGVGLAFAALLLLLALMTYNPHDPSLNTATAQGPSNWVGLAGSTIADVLLQSFGLAAFLPVLVLIAWCWRVLNAQRAHLPMRAMAALFALPAVAALLGGLPHGAAVWPTGAGWGGAIGGMLAPALAAMGAGMLGSAGAPLVIALLAALAALLLLLALGLTGREWRAAGNRVGRAAEVSARGGRGAAGFVARSTRRFQRQAAPPLEQMAVAPPFTPVVPKPARPAAPPPAPIRPDRPSEAPANAFADLGADLGADLRGDLGADPAADKARIRVAVPKPPTPVQPSLPLAEGGWQFPPLSLLTGAPARDATGPTDDSLQANARLLESVLSDYGVQGAIREIRPGPVVTLYELEPAPGIRSARVIGLADDVARSLCVTAVRIATVSGRNVIGIEVPNAKRETVFLSELLDSADWRGNSAKLALALGKDISGAPVIADLARMPHLLIAGTTGSGKSVGINAMILSLLYRLSPDQCRMIMIDPKMLELSVYEGIPHLLAPVVTEPSKAVAALKWTTREMERRYRAMSQLGVRNVGGYNEKVAEALATGKVPTRQVQVGFDSETGRPMFESQPLALKLLPYIVVVIDEMADLMMVAGKEVEAAVQRLAQMARAAGIHVIMATQRPSVDVITGTIKANFPTRISFQVISKFDSRTILGEQGAEQLLGMGDLLHMQGGGRISRVHGPFVRDAEVEQIVEFLRAQAEPTYDEEITDGAPDDADHHDGANSALSGIAAAGDSDKSLFDQAVAFVSREGRASTSLIQRHLRIGYNRAATLIEQMEKEGIVTGPNHAGKRDVLTRVERDDE